MLALACFLADGGDAPILVLGLLSTRCWAVRDAALAGDDFVLLLGEAWVFATAAGVVVALTFGCCRFTIVLGGDSTAVGAG